MKLVAFSQRMPPVQKVAIFLAFMLCRFCADPGGKLAETFRTRINRIAEGTDAVFIIIARIDHNHIGVADQRVPVSGSTYVPDLYWDRLVH